MAQVEDYKVICPFCRMEQFVREFEPGKRVFCQKCGSCFEIAANKQDTPYPVIGQLAITYRFLTELQLKKALEIRNAEAELGKRTTLEEILVKHDFLTPKKMQVLHHVKSFLDLRRLDREFGDIAVEKGYVGKSDIEKCLIDQSDLFKRDKSIRNLGWLLVEREKLTEAQRKEILQLQGRVQGPGKIEELSAEKPFVSPDDGLQPKSDRCRIEVSKDALTAYLYIGADDMQSLSLESIQRLAHESGIRFGIVADEIIRDLLAQARIAGKRWTIAAGKPLSPATDTVITYNFMTEYLEAGAIDEEGKIDFKDRGKIPQVKAGDILAEKKIGVEGKAGMDVYGKLIEVQPMVDHALYCGTGAQSAENGRIAVAQYDGQPMLTFDGKICVNKNLAIDGDVDFKTGHIDFDGNVIVTGAVQEGFRVRCWNLTAAEIAGGEIDARGDIRVSAGIIESRIQSQGSISATYIKNSHIHAYANVVAKKEILESEIACSGICQVRAGSILASSISSHKGVYSLDIGNGISKPSKLKIGSDDHMQAQMKKADDRLHEIKEEENMCCEKSLALAEQQKTLQNMVAEMAHEQERVIREKEALEYTLGRFAKKKNKRNLGHARSRLKDFENKIAQIDETVNRLFDEQEQVQSTIEQVNADLEAIWSRAVIAKAEKEAILKWIESEKPAAVIRVSGIIYEGTEVIGPSARLVLRENYKNVQLREIKPESWGGMETATIQIKQNNR